MAPEAEKTSLQASEVRQFAQKLASLESLTRVGQILQDSEIPAVAVKGAWLLREVYPEAVLRPITDVDLVVAHRDFERCQSALVSRGATIRNDGDPRQVTVFHSDFPLPIDLHRELFPYRTFSLTAEQLLAASRTSPITGIRFPNAMQGLAHLVGHFALNRDIDANLARAMDFQHVGEHFGLQPAEAAAAIDQYGVARAARYCFGLLSLTLNAGELTFARQVVKCLPEDLFGAYAARLCTESVLRNSPRSSEAAVLRCLLQPTLSKIYGSALGRMVIRGNRRALAHRGAPSVMVV